MEQPDVKVSYLASDNNYYNNVFKKTERIVSTILYIVSETEETPHAVVFYDMLKAKSIAALEAALASLTLQPPAHRRGLFGLQHALVGVGSALQVATAGNVVSEAVSGLVAAEIDAVQRYLKHHYIATTGFTLNSEATTSTSGNVPRSNPTATTFRARPAVSRAPSRSHIPPGDISTDAYLVYSQLTDRGERIKTVLSAKPEATIKDIAEVITDVSEKTIQRELNSLIEKGQVIRQGERRWSRYSIAK